MHTDEQDKGFAAAIEAAADAEFQATLRHAAALWAAELLVSRPEDTQESQAVLEFRLVTTHETALTRRLWEALERDDEDTDETARLVFEALAS